MYIPEQYKNENLAEIRDFIRSHPFGSLVSQVDAKPWATHIPLELETDEEGRDWLVGHISKANRQWRGLTGQEKVLCIFMGPHSYISSSWYREEEVPTWDYIAVHAYGALQFQENSELYRSLDRLLTRFESSSENPVSLSALSKNTLRQIKGIVGFRIAVSEFRAAYKLSQGRPSDHASIIRALEATGDPDAMAVARAIRVHGRAS
jgi:transcriptional regulator